MSKAKVLLGVNFSCIVLNDELYHRRRLRPTLRLRQPFRNPRKKTRRPMVYLTRADHPWKEIKHMRCDNRAPTRKSLPLAGLAPLSTP